MQTNETPITAVLNPIFDVITEDRQKIKALEKENEQLRAENEELAKLAKEYIKKCDELSAENKRLIRDKLTIRPPISPCTL